MSRLIGFFMTLVAILLMHSLNIVSGRASARHGRPPIIGRPALR